MAETKKEYKITTTGIKGIKSPFHLAVVMVISGWLADLILFKFPGAIDFINSFNPSGLLSLIGINQLDENTFPMLIAFIVISCTAMVINWWKQVFVPWFKRIDTSFLIKKKE